MTKEDILNYVVETPHNTNPNMIGNMIDILLKNNSNIADENAIIYETSLFNNNAVFCVEEDDGGGDIKVKATRVISQQSRTYFDTSFTIDNDSQVYDVTIDNQLTLSLYQEEDNFYCTKDNEYSIKGIPSVDFNVLDKIIFNDTVLGTDTDEFIVLSDDVAVDDCNINTQVFVNDIECELVEQQQNLKIFAADDAINECSYTVGFVSKEASQSMGIPAGLIFTWTPHNDTASMPCKICVKNYKLNFSARLYCPTSYVPEGDDPIETKGSVDGVSQYLPLVVGQSYPVSIKAVHFQEKSYERAVDLITSQGQDTTLTSNGTFDVAEYAYANVSVDPPQGTLSITSNGFHDVASFANVSVNVGVSYPSASITFTNQLKGEVSGAPRTPIQATLRLLTTSTSGLAYIQKTIPASGGSVFSVPTASIGGSGQSALVAFYITSDYDRMGTITIKISYTDGTSDTITYSGNPIIQYGSIKSVSLTSVYD